MSFQLRKITAALFVPVAAVFSLGNSSAADSPTHDTATHTQSAPSKETREKLAQIHEQAAACLRSDKSIAECRTEMMKSCHDSASGMGCPMGEMGMGMHGGHADHTTQTPPAKDSKK